ncbi:MAG TPA: cell envelope integrity protein TolA [Burkholderiales bacterium]|nr:cell envelope integrity protein TolA [Burkholderiales bacterium]
MRSAAEREPGRTASFILAVLMHLLFIGLLVFGISWQNKQPQVTEVDLWNKLPAPPQPVELPKPVKEVKPPPEPPKQEVKPEPKPEPVVKSEPKPEPVKADILLKQKLEKEKAEKIEKEKAAKEKRKLEEQKLAEEKRAVEAERRQIQEQLAKEEDARRLQQEQKEALEALQKDQMAAQAAAQDRLLKDYTDRIHAKIHQYVVVPPDIQGNPEATYKVVLLPGGDVLSAALVKSSGVPAYDSSIERAIYKAQPLPLPPDPALFAKFRELELKFRPND